MVSYRLIHWCISMLLVLSHIDLLARGLEETRKQGIKEWKKEARKQGNKPARRRRSKEARRQCPSAATQRCLISMRWFGALARIDLLRNRSRVLHQPRTFHLSMHMSVHRFVDPCILFVACGLYACWKRNVYTDLWLLLLFSYSRRTIAWISIRMFGDFWLSNVRCPAGIYVIVGITLVRVSGGSRLRSNRPMGPPRFWRNKRLHKSLPVSHCSIPLSVPV